MGRGGAPRVGRSSVEPLRLYENRLYYTQSISPVGVRSFGPHVLPRFSRPQGKLVHGRKLPPTRMRTFESPMPIILIGPKFFAPSPATRKGRPALSESSATRKCACTRRASHRGGKQRAELTRGAHLASAASSHRSSDDCAQAFEFLSVESVSWTSHACTYAISGASKCKIRLGVMPPEKNAHPRYVKGS